ncbi:hypothetical protein SABIM44S_02446 [Streptomyces abikoensis]
MLDLYRSARLGQPAPPAPGTGDVEAVRSFRTWRAFRGVVDERVAARRARRAELFRLLTLRGPRPTQPLLRPAPATPRPYPAQHRTRRVPDTCGRTADC